MNTIYTICNQKGGVGKTTTCVNLGAALGILEKKVLIIDTDPQAHSILSFGIDPPGPVSETLQFMQYTSNIKNNIMSTKSPNVDVLPLQKKLQSFKITIKDNKQQLFVLKQSLKQLKAHYDYILIDCVPFLHSDTFSILIASDAVIVPVQSDYYGMEGLHRFLKTVRFIQQNYHKDLDIEGFLLTMYNSRLNSSKSISVEMSKHFKELVFYTKIHRNVAISEAPSHGKSIIDFDVSSKGAQDYLNLANELIFKNERASTALHSSENDPLIVLKKEFKSGLVDVFEKECNVDSIETVFNKLYENNYKYEISITNYTALVGLSKAQINFKLGLCYNDINSNVWMYRLKDISKITKKRFLYIYFSENIATLSILKRFKLVSDRLNIRKLFIENIK